MTEQGSSILEEEANEMMNVQEVARMIEWLRAMGLTDTQLRPPSLQAGQGPQDRILHRGHPGRPGRRHHRIHENLPHGQRRRRHGRRRPGLSPPAHSFNRRRPYSSEPK